MRCCSSHGRCVSGGGAQLEQDQALGWTATKTPEAVINSCRYLCGEDRHVANEEATQGEDTCGGCVNNGIDAVEGIIP